MADPILRQRCFWCRGRGCERCDGTGELISTRNEAWHRKKHFLGRDRPGANKDGYEKWPRFTAEIPPELVPLLEAAQRKSLGINWDGYMDRPRSATRSNMVQAALRMYLETIDPEGDLPIDATAVELEEDDIKELGE